MEPLIIERTALFRGRQLSGSEVPEKAGSCEEWNLLMICHLFEIFMELSD